MPPKSPSLSTMPPTRKRPSCRTFTLHQSVVGPPEYCDRWSFAMSPSCPRSSTFRGRERDVRDESALVCLGGAGRQCIEAVLPLATDEVRVDVRAPSRSAVFRYGQHVSAVGRFFTRHNPLVSKSGRLSRVRPHT